MTGGRGAIVLAVVLFSEHACCGERLLWLSGSGRSVEWVTTIFSNLPVSSRLSHKRNRVGVAGGFGHKSRKKTGHLVK